MRLLSEADGLSLHYRRLALAQVVLLLMGILLLILAIYGPNSVDRLYKLFRQLPAQDRLGDFLERYGGCRYGCLVQSGKHGN
jgi:predicted PurR-regulated permease PerM